MRQSKYRKTNRNKKDCSALCSMCGRPVLPERNFFRYRTSICRRKQEENCHHSINSETPEHENRGLFFECADSFILKPAEDHEHVFLSSRNTLGIQTVKKTVVSDLMNP